MKILYYIFSWKGQYENACKLEEIFKSFGDVIVINSDDDNTPEHWINIGNECYFSDQFRNALQLFNENEYDVLCHVQADASSDEFSSIVESAKTTFEKYNWGVYAPNVDDTFYTSPRTDVFALYDNLKVVATPDNTCWFIHKDMIHDMKMHLNLMKNNHLGWGWDLLICAFAHLKQRKVIRDYNYTIDHPLSTGYMKEQAEQEMQEMFDLCSNDLKQIIYYIKMVPQAIIKYYDVVDDDIIVYDTNRGLI